MGPGSKRENGSEYIFSCAIHEEVEGAWDSGHGSITEVARVSK